MYYFSSYRGFKYKEKLFFLTAIKLLHDFKKNFSLTDFNIGIKTFRKKISVKKS